MLKIAPKRKYGILKKQLICLYALNLRYKMIVLAQHAKFLNVVFVLQTDAMLT